MTDNEDEFLKTAENAKSKIKEAREMKGWTVDSVIPLHEACKVINPNWKKCDALITSVYEASWKDFLYGKRKVIAHVYKAYAQIVELNWEELIETSQPKDSNNNYQASTSPSTQNYDWYQAPEIICFYGRSKELETLEKWIIKDSCKLIAILGVGGIGKTSLSINIGKKVQNNFKYVIWRSLRNAPSLKELLVDLLQVISSFEQEEIKIDDDIENNLIQLINYFRKNRCLLILDNAETILLSQNRVGVYRKGYENYERLLNYVGELQHQSCLLITSREKFRELAKLEGNTKPVRALKLADLETIEAKKIFEDENLSDTEGNIEKIVKLHCGNPLYLKIVAGTVKELFSGDITAFVEGEEIFLGDIQDILEQQFNRLSELEKSVMFWLAISHELVSLNELHNNIIPCLKRTELMESLQCLERRHLIEKSFEGFTQQPVIMEYIVCKIIDMFCQSIITEKYDLFNSYSVIKAQSKDYVRQTQIELILKPLANTLTRELGNIKKVEAALMKCIANIRANNFLENGYAGGNVINLLSQLGINISGYDFSNLTIRQAYLQEQNLDRVNFTNSNLDNSVFTETFGDVISLAFSLDGKLVAIGTSNAEIRLWQVDTGKHLSTYKGHNGWVRSIAFSPDNELLVSGGDDKTIRICNINSGENLGILRKHTDRIESVVFISDEQLVSAGDDKTIRIWNIKQCQYVKILGKHNHLIRTLSFNSKKLIIASGSEDKTIKIWNVETGQCLETLKGNSGWVVSVDFSSNGLLLASGGQEGVIEIWNVETGKCLKTLQGHSNSVRSVCFNKDGSLLASGSNDNTIKVWNVETGKCLKTLQGHSSRVRNVKFRNDGITLASGSDDQTLKFWDLKTGQIVKTLQGFTNRIWSVAFSPDSKLLASSSDEPFVRLWDATTGKCKHILKGHSNSIKGLCFRYDYDRQLLVSCGDDQTIRFWNVQTGECLNILRGHKSWVGSLDFSPDGTYLISGSGDNTVRLWDAIQGEYLSIFEGHTNRVWSVAFSPNGKIIASAGSDEIIRIWDKSTRQEITNLTTHKGWIWSIAFNLQGDKLISGSSDCTIKLWDVKTGECINTFEGHENWVRTVAFNFDGKIIASGSDDQTIRIWETETGKCLYTIPGHNSWIKSIAFSPDGLTLASGSFDETVKLWDVKTGKYKKTIRNPRPYEGMNITNVSGITEAQRLTLIALGAVENNELINFF